MATGVGHVPQFEFVLLTSIFTYNADSNPYIILDMSAVNKCLNGLKSKFTVVLGGQWGDQGKGKLVDLLSSKYDVIARFNGGANAGHTVYRGQNKFAFHLLPCGLLQANTKNLIGNGVVVSLESMFKELDQLEQHKIDYKNRLFVSDRAHLVTKYQINQDIQNQKTQNIGTTKKGIGPTYSAKINRFGLTVGDLYDWRTFAEKYQKMSKFYSFKLPPEDLMQLRVYRDRLIEGKMIVNGVSWINRQISQKKRVLAEGANAALLDIDLGTYPYVTSSSTTVGGVCTGLGVSHKAIQTVIGVVKAYTTRVGEGPFPTQLNDQTGAHLRKKGHEFGTTTGRPRRCGWLDIPIIRYTNMVNGYDSINITKLDVLDQLQTIQVGVHYTKKGSRVVSYPGTLAQLQKMQVKYQTLPGWKSDTTNVRRRQDLPKNAYNYLKFIEDQSGIPISWVGTGPSQEAMFQFH